MTTRVWREESDEGLVRGCVAGERAAWEELIRRYRRLIYSLPAAYGLSPESAADVFQRVIVKLLEQLARIERGNSLCAWLITTTRRECQALSARERRFAPPLEDGDPTLVADPPDVARAIDAVRAEQLLALALERLDEPCRRLLEALYVEDPPVSYQELAVRLGRPVGSLGPTRGRCLGKLRKLFLALGGEER